MSNEPLYFVESLWVNNNVRATNGRLSLRLRLPERRVSDWLTGAANVVAVSAAVLVACQKLVSAAAKIARQVEGDDEADSPEYGQAGHPEQP